MNNPVTVRPKHKDEIEKLDGMFYVRFQSGPDYERAYICIEDGEPDMHDIAQCSFKQARMFMSAYKASHAAPASPSGQALHRNIKLHDRCIGVGCPECEADAPAPAQRSGADEVRDITEADFEQYSDLDGVDKPGDKLFVFTPGLALTTPQATPATEGVDNA